jgi:hypothetical protein
VEILRLSPKLATLPPMVWIIAYFNATSEPLMWKYNTEGDSLDDYTIGKVLDSALTFFHVKYPQLKVDPTKKHTYEYCLSTKGKWRCGFSAWTRLIHSNALLSHFMQQDDDAFEINMIPGYKYDLDAKEEAIQAIVGYKLPPGCDLSRDCVEENKYTCKRKKFWKKLEKEMFRDEWGFSSSEEEQEKSKKKAKK